MKDYCSDQVLPALAVKANKAYEASLKKTYPSSQQVLFQASNETITSHLLSQLSDYLPFQYIFLRYSRYWSHFWKTSEMASLFCGKEHGRKQK